MLPDRSVLIGQKLEENAKIQKFKCDILSNFQTMFLFISITMTSIWQTKMDGGHGTNQVYQRRELHDINLLDEH